MADNTAETNQVVDATNKDLEAKQLEQEKHLAEANTTIDELNSKLEDKTSTEDELETYVDNKLGPDYYKDAVETSNPIFMGTSQKYPMPTLV